MLVQRLKFHNFYGRRRLRDGPEGNPIITVRCGSGKIINKCAKMLKNFWKFIDCPNASTWLTAKVRNASDGFFVFFIFRDTKRQTLSIEGFRPPLNSFEFHFLRRSVHILVVDDHFRTTLSASNEIVAQSKIFEMNVTNRIRLDRCLTVHFELVEIIWRLLCTLLCDERVPAVLRRLLYSIKHGAKAKTKSQISLRFGNTQRIRNLISALRYGSRRGIFQFRPPPKKEYEGLCRLWEQKVHWFPSCNF